MKEAIGKVAARVFEFLYVAVGARRSRSAAALLGNVAKLALLAAFGTVLLDVAAPLAAFAAISAKRDWTGLPHAVSFYLDAGGGWGAVRASGDPTASSVELVARACTAFLWALVAIYALNGMRRYWRRSIFGGKEPVRGGEANSDARVEVSDIVLASTTRTWKPGASIEHAGLVLGYSAPLHRYYLSGEEESPSSSPLRA